MIRGFYTLEEAAQIAGLKPGYLRILAYTSTLTRGRDFTTLRRYRFGRCQHKIAFTRLGLERLVSRDYRRFSSPKRRPGPRDAEIISRLYREAKGVKLGSPNSIEGKLRRKQLRIAELAHHLFVTTCPIRACQCICHNVGGQNYPVILDAKTSTDAPEVAFTASKEEK